MLRDQLSSASMAAVLCAASTLIGCRSPENPPRVLAPLLGPTTTTIARWTGGVLAGPDVLREPSTSALAKPITEPTPEPTSGPAPEPEPTLAPPAATAPAQPRAMRRIRVTLDALDQALSGGAPLARSASLGANLDGAIALSAENPLLLSGRMATGGDAVAWLRAVTESTESDAERAPFALRAQRVLTHDELLLDGAVVALALSAIDVDRVADDFLREYSDIGPYLQRIEVLVGYAGDALEVAVAVVDRDRTERATMGSDPTATGSDASLPRRSEHGPERRLGAQALRRDFATLSAAPVSGGAPLAVLVPSPLDAGAARFFLVRIEVVPTAEDQTQGATERADPARAEARLAAADALYAALADAPDARWLEARNALAAIQQNDGRRTALLTLADGRGATLAAELALVSDDEGLAAFAARLAGLQVGPRADIGWLLERAALRHAAALLADDTAPEALRAGLLRRAGQAGRFPGVLDDVATASKSLPELEARLNDENLLYLEDSDPAARLRAFRWLSARDAAPAGFAALDPPEVRRAALRAARQGGAR
ncbi:MAG: hypothetical protein R3F49_19675 [Planctomycetota bacterium]